MSFGGAEMSRPDPQLFNLKWKNYQSHIMSVFDKILLTESFSDVTLVCADVDQETTHAIKAHKIILGASSPYFEMVFSEHPCQHPVVVMPPEVKIDDLQQVLQFVYKGEVQVPQDQLEPVLRCASQLRIRGLDSEYSRESSLEPDRPASQQSGSSKRKTSPKFHFLKNRRKNLLPSKLEEIKIEETVQDDTHSIQDEEVADKWERGVSPPAVDVESEEPVDFTIKNEHGSPNPEVQEHDMTDMAAFIASATAAVRNAGQGNYQDMMDPSSSGNPPTLSSNSSHHPVVPFPSFGQCNKTYTKRDMNLALEALRSKKLSLSRASEIYGIPPTTLWQRANRMGIPTPKKETSTKSWTDEDLQSALEALRKKEISANKASKVYKIPSSTLYKIARKEGIELAQPFNAVATTWNQDDLNTALEAIRGGMAVQKAATEFGIPSGTLYGRCKKVGIELSKNTQVHWSEDDMSHALDSVRTGNMSINQAAIHYHLPYSSLYGRINRLKREQAAEWAAFRDYDLDPELEDNESSNGVDYSGFLSGPPVEFDESCDGPGDGPASSAAALLQSLANHGGLTGHPALTHHSANL